MSVSVCSRSYLRNYTSDFTLFLLRMAVSRSSSGGVVIRYVIPVHGDVVFAHKPSWLDVAVQLKRSAHAALGLATNCAQ